DILLSGVNSLARRVSTYATSDDIKLGNSPNAKGTNIIAIGNNIQVHSQNNLFDAVTIVGNNSKDYAAAATIVGGWTEVREWAGVALGYDSVADRASGVSGYSPYKKANATGADAQWKSGYGAVSVGDVSEKKTRQIIGVAAGSELTDAVNVAQIKSLQNYVDKGWQLSVGGADATTIGIESKIDLSAASENLQISKGKDDNNIKFDLAKEIAVNKVTAGSSTLDATGLVIANGPKITTGGVDAGGKKITGVATGTESTDAVNFAQLKEIKEQVAASSFIKQDVQTKYITIGKDTDGDKITITNKDNKTRILSGVAGGADDTDAVNVAQLKALKDSITPSWDLSVDGADTTSVDSTNPMDLAAGSSNLNITKGKEDNKVKFDLAKDITLESVKAGTNTLDATGLVIANGPKIIISGIDAGGKKITGVSDGTGANDAVNFSQLSKTNEGLSSTARNLETAMANTSKYFGGKTDVLKGMPPSYAVQNQTYENITDAFVAVDSSFNKMKDNINKQVADVRDSILVKKNEKTGLITIGKDLLEPFGIDFSDIKASPRTLSGVAAGTKETDAVNFSQLKDVKEQVAASSFVKQDAETRHISIGKETDGDKIDIANKKNEKRTLTGIKNGALTEASNEAVNGSQLFETNKNVTTVTSDLKTASENVVKYFGGGASYKDGAWTAPTFKLKTFTADGKEDGSKDYTDVGSAFAGIDTNFINVNKHLNTVVNNFNDKLNDINKEFQGDALLWSKTDKAFSAMHGEGKDRSSGKIKYLTGGDLTQNSEEAVNGGQLYIVGTHLANYLGGGADFGNGNSEGPTFKIKTFDTDGEEKSETYQNVADAFEGVNTALTTVQNKLTEQVNNVITKVESESFVQQDKTTSRLTIGAKVGGAEINIANESGADRIISGVGEAKNNNDAVNKSQLDSNIKNVNDNVTNKFSELTKNITNITQQVKGDALLWNDKANAFVARHEKSKEEKGRAVRTQENSRITFLANGEITANSTDAVTGGQLYLLNEQLATYFGGGAGYDEQGQWKAPSFKVKAVKDDGKSEEIDYGNVADALAGVGNSFTNIRNEISKEINNEIANVKGDSLVKKDQATNLITIGKEVEGSEINIANSSKADRTLSGVKAATKNNEAVNKGQLDKGLKDLSTSLQSDDSAVVHYDKQKDGAPNYMSITLGGKDKTPVALHNVAKGVISSESYDAINGQQINKIGGDIAKFLGGNAAFSNGAFSEPSYGVHDIRKTGDVDVSPNSHHNVGSALSALDYSLGNVNTRITNTINDFNKKITDSSQHIEKDALLWNDEANAFVAQHKTEEGKKENSKITSLADGSIVSGSSDAVTGGQINTIAASLSKILGGKSSFSADGTFTVPSYDLSTVSKDGEVTDKPYEGVEKAFKGLDTNIKTVNARIKEVSEGVAQDSLLWSNESNAFVAQHKTEEGKKENSKITFLSNGEVSSSSSDAINGSQLFETNKTVATYLGGGAEYTEGKWTNPKFTVKTFDADGESKDQNYPDVASALTGVGSSITNVKNEITKQINNEINNVRGDSLVKKDADTNLITIGKEVEGSEINIANKTGTDRTLSGVGEATKDNEAVNKGQLDASLKELSTSLQSDDSAVVHYDKKDGDNGGIDYTSVTLGKGKDAGPVALHNVKDGAIGESSHDAINGSQINTISQNVAKFLGGDAKFVDGTFTGPTYKLSKVDTDGSVASASFENVGSAFIGLDDNIKNVNARIKEVSEGVAQDSLNWSKEANAFVARHEKKQEEKGRAVRTQENSRITFLANGEISAKSTDAVTGSQLYSMNQTFATYFGGGAGYDKDGQWKAPNFVIKKVNAEGTESEESYKSVAEALSDISSSVTNVHHDVTNVVSESLVKQDDETAPITVGKETNGTVINVANKSGVKRVISGVEDAKDNNDAVNKGQLDASLKELSSSLQSDDSAVVHYDKKDGDNGGIDYTSVTLGKGKDKAAVGLHNVADGQIAKGSHDAITGGQINKIGEDVAKFLGGEASFKDGALTQPRYKLSHISEDGQVSTSAFDGVGGAFEGLDANIKNVNQRIKEVSEGVAQDSLNWSNEANAFVAKHGTEGSNSKLKFLLDGDITANSTDAITGNQLYSVNQTVATYFGGGAGYENGKWVAPTFKLKTINEDG
ncbi:hypothetical protein, partial [Bartonella sp. CL32QHWL-2]|uniref:hypothetical protein n=1 Tax=Bartonella sp. CL32QHWL-2 TaxID=3243525 RepID=UPI0035CF847F